MSATVAGAPLPVERWKDRALYTGMAVAVIATIYRGFARSYFLRGQYFSTPMVPMRSCKAQIFVMGCAVSRPDSVERATAEGSSSAAGDRGGGVGSRDGRRRYSDSHRFDAAQFRWWQ